jgi:predicted chitinase
MKFNDIKKQQDVNEAPAPSGVSHFVTHQPTYRSPEKISSSHRIAITYTEDDSPETFTKTVRVTASSPDEAAKKAAMYLTRMGWNVTKATYIGKLDENELEEGWKDWVAGGAMALGAMGAQAGNIATQIVDPGDTVYKIARDNGVHPSVIMKLNGFNNQTKLTPGQEVKVPDVYTKDATPADKQPEVKNTKSAITKGIQSAQTKTAAKTTQSSTSTVTPVTNNPLEKIVLAAAIKNGITGTELAAFMAQVAHESHDFQSMVEYGGSLDFRKYDIRYNPKKAKELGNKYAGDGNRYKGRGFIQITGRYNYRIASKAIGVDLVKNPALAEDPTIAAKIAVWFWKHRVQPNVENWNNVRDVTKPINPGLNGLEDREENFKEYVSAMVSPTDKTSAKV